MIFDSITLSDGADFINLVVASGTSFPTGSPGELFYKTDTEKLYISNGSTWGPISTDLTFTPVNKAGDTMTGALVLSADPVIPLGAASKQYVDAVATGLSLKKSVRVATTANISLSGTQTIDGVAVTAGNRVLVKNQTTASQNGIYVVASGTWARSDDADNSPVGEVIAGMFCFVSEGTLQADTGWVLVTNDSITLGTTALSFTQFTSATSIPVVTAAQIPFGSAANLLTSSSSLKWDDTIKALSLGVASTTAGSIVGAASVALSITAGFEGALNLTGGDTSNAISGPVNITGGYSGGGSSGANVNISGGGANTGYGAGSGGNVVISGGQGGSGVGSIGGSIILNSKNGYSGAGSIVFQSNSTERFRFLASGALSVGSSGSAVGTTGQVLTSNGDASPTWSTLATGFAGGSITPSGSNTGFATTIFGGQAGGAGNNGGALLLTGGIGGSTGNAGIGGAVTLRGGLGEYMATPGGYITIPGGNNLPASSTIDIVSSGAINLTSGGKSGYPSGDINLTGGSHATATNGGAGGNIVLTGGNTASNGTAGSITLSTGISTGGGTNGTIILKTNNTERLRILSSGAISIGSTGTAYGTTGQVLTSNGNAAPTWQSSPGGASLSAANVWTAAQAGAIATLTAGASVTPNFALSNNFKLAPVQNFTLAFPTNPTPGQSGLIIITQDSTGGRVVTWATGWVAAGGVKPALSTAANSVDYISYFVETSSRVFVSVVSNVS